MGAIDFIVRLGLNSTQFTTGTDKAKGDLESLQAKVNSTFSSFGKFKDGIVGAFRGAAFAAPLLSIFNQLDQRLDNLIAKAKEIKIGTIRTGLDAQTFQRVSNVAESKGVDPSSIETAIEKTADAMQSIRDGADQGAKLQMAFARLGVTMSDISKKDHAQVFLQIADAMHSAELSTEKIAALGDIFGRRKAGELLPVFRAGFNTQAANRGVLDDEQLAAVEAERKRKKEFESPWDEMLNEGATSKWFALPRAMWRTVRHPFQSIGAGAFKAARDLGYLDDKSEYSYDGQGDAMDASEERIVANRKRNAIAEATKEANRKKVEDAAKKLEQAQKEIARQKREILSQQTHALKGGSRLASLHAQDASLSNQINASNADIYNGDPDGQKTIRRNELLLERGRIRAELKQSMGSEHGISLIPRDVSERTRIGLSSGAGINVPPIFNQQLMTMETQVQRLDSVVNELRNLRRSWEE